LPKKSFIQRRVSDKSSDRNIRKTLTKRTDIIYNVEPGGIPAGSINGVDAFRS
jgi:hypothetical protein